MRAALSLAAILAFAPPAGAVDQRGGKSLGDAALLGRAFSEGPAKVALSRHQWLPQLEDALPKVRALHAAFEKKEKDKLEGLLADAYKALGPHGFSKDKAILAKARETYGLPQDAALLRDQIAQWESAAAKMPPEQQKATLAKVERWKKLLSQDKRDDLAAEMNASAQGLFAGGRWTASQRAAVIEKFRNTPLYANLPRIVREPPPAPARGGPVVVLIEGIPLNAAQQRRVLFEVDRLAHVVAGDSLQPYMNATDKRQILAAWTRATARSTSYDGSISHKKAVNLFRDELLNGRESSNGTTRTAEHWGEIAAGTYNLGKYAGPPAAMVASFGWNVFSVTKSQLMRSYRYFRGQGPAPPAGNYWGETINQSLMTESAAAGWASALDNDKNFNLFQGTVQTLKLDELVTIVKQDGVGKTASGLGDRYFGK